MKKIFILLFFLPSLNLIYAQPFTHADTLRGSNGPGRAWWDATHYDLHVKFNIPDSTISGYNVVNFKPTSAGPGYFQIDLMEPLIMDSVILEYGNKAVLVGMAGRRRRLLQREKRKLDFERDGNAFFVKLEKRDAKEVMKWGMKTADNGKFLPSLTLFYHGKPRSAKRPPWDGGLVWKKDKWGNPFIGVACQGVGASIWYPCKDYQGDEPDSAAMHFTGPDSLMIISNGRMRDSVNNHDGTHTISWAVVNPINNYDISPYIGKYVHWQEIYPGAAGPLTMDYWVLDSNLTIAKKHFVDATRMMKAFEHWFGPYPFYKDGYKLVEAPYLGMEHQSAIAYGNHYKMGYLGRDLSGTGWGLKWDFIIVHESGHEWFGNNITTKDIADMWVHEGFTNYSETLFTEYYYGKEAAKEYIIGIRKAIQNDKPIVGYYGVNDEGSGDMYYKAGNMIHAIRQIINNDEKFRSILRGLNEHFRHQTVMGKQVEDYINEKSGIDFSKVFEQYLTTIKIPELEYKKENGKMAYRWTNCVDGFNMPIRIYDANGKPEWIHPTQQWQNLSDPLSAVKVDDNFYVKTKEAED